MDNKRMLSPSLIKFFALFNIILQVAFPLAATFSPLIVSAKSENYFLNSSVPSLQTRVYTLASGETVNTVAARFNMSVTDLHKVNQFRTFANGFNYLKPGDELEVPLAPLPKVHWDKASETVTDRQNEQAQKIAGMATTFGEFLSGSPNEGKATSTVRGMATSEANGQLEQFLGKFGTARVQLNVDDNSSLKNSQLDLLIPIYEQYDRLIFTQGSVHRTDDRSQANLGFGFRHFYDSWMMGANTFFDYDFSRDHARSGVGLEYGRDFFKLSSNGYTPLTGWKESPDVKGYDERPARGWDIRAQGWVPALPQLGGKLTYEQYYGKEVALFGKDNRQHNPRALTAGVTYTPVPLLTLTAEKKQGQSRKNDARFGLGLTWQPGVPLRQQLDPAGVEALRTLTGGRYDLVERNNNIVLEYRKRNDIKLQTVELVSGYSGEEKSLGVSVSSRYNLKQIEWQATELEAAGGRISKDAGNVYNVILPNWQSSPNSSNNYVVSGVAIDSRGNRSNRSDTQVTVQAPMINRDRSSFTPGESTLPADDKSSQTLTLTIRDDQNNLIDVEAGEVALSVLKRAETKVSVLVRKSAGVYEITVMAGIVSDNVKITPTVMGVSLSTATVIITNKVPDGIKSTFSSSNSSIVADNLTTTTVTFQAIDITGNKIAGIADDIKFLVKDEKGNVVSSGVTVSNINESSPGIYTAQLRGSQTGRYTVFPLVNGNLVGELNIVVVLVNGAVDGSQSTFTITNSSIPANNIDTTVLTLSAKDSQGNHLSGITKELSFMVKDSSGTQDSDGVSVSEIKEGTSGVYTATLKGSLVGNYTVIPQISGIAVGNLSQSVALTKIPELLLTTQIMTNNAIANGINENIIRVTLRDEKGESADFGVTVSLAAGDDQFVTYPSSLQLNNGTVDFSVKSVKAGDYTFTFAASTPDTTAQTTQSVTFAIDDSKARVSLTTDSERLLAAYKESRNITLTLTDGDGNPFEESKSVSINVTSYNGVLSLAKVDGNDASSVITMQLPAGQTSKTFTFSSAIAGNYMINASYAPSIGSAITATVGEEATIEISGWKYKTTGGTGKTVSTSFRPSYIAQGDTAQILLNDTADYNSYYSFSLTGSNPAFSIDSDTVSLAPVITNASRVSAGASVTVGARNGTSQLTASPVYALMASSGVISTGNGNTWLSWGNNASYCQKDGNDTVSMNDFKTYQSETGAIRTNNENSLWTGTGIANTQQAYFFAANGTFVAAGIYENKVGVCILPR